MDKTEEMTGLCAQTTGKIVLATVSQERDVYDVIVPSRERALLLNKAYRCIVEDQDYIHGKDATVSPPLNVYDRIDNKTSPTLPKERTYRYNIALDWGTDSAD